MTWFKTQLAGGNQLAIYKRGRRIWTRDDREQIQQVARAGLETGTAWLRVLRADHSATLPTLTCNLGRLLLNSGPPAGLTSGQYESIFYSKKRRNTPKTSEQIVC